MISKRIKIINTAFDWCSKIFALVVVYLAVYQNFWVAKNFVYFLNFLTFLSAMFFIFCKEEAKEFFENQKNKVYYSKLNAVYEWIVILSFVSMAWFGSAFIWFISWSAKKTFIDWTK